jgi:hypothetical protein
VSHIPWSRIRRCRDSEIPTTSQDPLLYRGGNRAEPPADGEAFARCEALDTAVRKANWEAMINPGDEELGGAAFIDSGISAVECTGYACAVRQLAGKEAEIVGFSRADNPSSEIAQNEGGHDFVFLEKRYIVDPWVCYVAGSSERSVFDTLNPGHADDIRRLYGDQTKWGRLPSTEFTADKYPLPHPVDPTLAELRGLLCTERPVLLPAPAAENQFQEARAAGIAL